MRSADASSDIVLDGRLSVAGVGIDFGFYVKYTKLSSDILQARMTAMLIEYKSNYIHTI